MTETRAEVGIVGAGPCGLLAALLLARRGVSVVIFDSKRELLNHPRAMGISRRTAEIFEQLGVRVAMQQNDMTPPEYALAIWAESLSGAEYGRVPLPPPVPDVAPYPGFHCPQTTTERVLLDALREESGADVRFGHVVESFTDNGDAVRLKGGSADGLFEFECRYLIGADGAGSSIRRALGIEGVGPGDLGHFINTFFRAPYGMHLEGRRAVLQNLLRSDSFEIFVAVNGSDLWLMHHFLQPGEKAEDFSPERLAGIIRDVSGLPEVPVEVLGVTQWVMSPKVATQFRKGRVFLTGDASARLSPAAGLGMNTGLQSAHNLAWKIAAVLRGAPESLLESYDAERRGHVMRTFEMSNDFGSEVWEILEAGFGGDFARVHDLVTHSRRTGGGLGIDLGFRYERGAFVAEGNAVASMDPDTYEPSAEPGRRAPHAWIERHGCRVSTLDLFGKGFVLLVAGDASAWRAEAGAVKLPEGFLLEVVPLCDANAEVAAIHGIEGNGAVLVRPDGVVGWRSGDGGFSGLQQAMESILRGG